MRLRPALIALVAAVLGLSSRPVLCGSIYVIAHSGTELSQQDVRDIFLGNKEFSGEIRLVPVENETVKTEFLDRILGVNRLRYDNIWIKKAFRDAIEPPAAKRSDSDVTDFVKHTPGAVGYVRNPPGKDVVLIISY